MLQLKQALHILLECTINSNCNSNNNKLFIYQSQDTPSVTCDLYIKHGYLYLSILDAFKND